MVSTHATPTAPGPARARLGLGTAALGRPEYLNVEQALAPELGEGRYDPERLREHAHAVLDAAYDAGVRHLDTARSYGAGEAFVGSWLAAHPARRAEVTVGSKWGYTYVADFRPGAPEHEVKDHSVATLARQWTETRRHLGLPDLYLVHSLTSDSPALEDAELLGRLRGIAEQGVRIGLSTSGPDQAAVLRRALGLPGSPFSTVQSTWNPLEPSVGPALAEAHDAGWLVVVKEAMANGRLAGPGSPLAGLAAELGLAPDALALATALHQPWSDVVLSGAGSVRHLQDNLRALEVGAGAVHEAQERLEGLAEGPQDYWRTRGALGWA